MEVREAEESRRQPVEEDATVEAARVEEAEVEVSE